MSLRCTGLDLQIKRVNNVRLPGQGSALHAATDFSEDQTQQPPAVRLEAAGAAELSEPEVALASTPDALGMAEDGARQLGSAPEASSVAAASEAGCVAAAPALGGTAPEAGGSAAGPSAEMPAGAFPPWANAVTPAVATNEAPSAKTSPSSLRSMFSSNRNPLGYIKSPHRHYNMVVCQSWQIVVGPDRMSSANEHVKRCRVCAFPQG